MNKIIKFYKNLSDGKKSALIGSLLIIILFSVLTFYSNKRKEKLESDFVWAEATITKIELNASKSTITTRDIFFFEYYHKGKKYRKMREFYKPELIKVGQKFKIKVHRNDPELIGIELEGI